jgi:mono/diheme cytochrome c family protein
MRYGDHDAASPRPPRGFVGRFRALALLAVALSCAPATAGEPAGAVRFHKDVEPILAEYCAGCHSPSSKKGGVVFEFDTDAALLENRDLWWRALKMVRAGMMPPKNKARPTPEQLGQLETWVKGSVFQIDPQNPDPGRVTVRRLNRVEYRNTIRDLMGVTYDTDASFPPDDTGHGFDNIGEVLTLSPLLLEKYVAAARSIVGQAVPTAPTAVAEHRIAGRRFGPPGTPAAEGDGFLPLSYYKPATVTNVVRAKHAGHYQLVLDLTANETFVDGQFDYNRCKLTLKADGKTLLEQQYSRQGNRPFHYESAVQEWPAGPHDLTLEVQPLTPGERQVRSLTLRIVSVTVRGPTEKEHWVPPPSYGHYFPRPVPTGIAERRQYARELLNDFAARAFRRPVDDESVDRLVRLAESHYTRDGQTFEAGVAQAMTVVLASPRFLFREEGTVPGSANGHPLVDEYALASRLSYFLWSSMPDAELFRLAGANQLRENLPAQVARMMADPKSSEFVRQFVGQWLQARDVESVEINARAVMSRDEVQDPQAQARQARFRELIRKPQDSLTEDEKKELAEVRRTFFGGFRRFAQFDLTGDLRRSMRRETEMLFEHVLRNDRSLLELIDSDYTFLNEKLARQYGIDGVKGDEMRLVKLPPDSPRGGVLTQGTVLTITSNPDRTSPVKRGLFILDNVLGTPPPPPPPDIPTLEEATTKSGEKPQTLRAALKIHREDALCASCHNRMDPLGLAFENFNALGRWRDKERKEPIDAAGQLITGETFTSVQELKRLLVANHRRDFFRCLTEKLLTYALGRGLDYYDVEAVDRIVDRLDRTNGKPSALVTGIIESVPFQKRRSSGPATTRSSEE